MMNLDKTTYGDWVSINSLIQRYTDEDKWGDNLAVWDLKMKVTSVFERDDYTEFDYSKWDILKDEWADSTNVANIDNNFDIYLKWRTNFIKIYSDYFGKGNDEEDDNKPDVNKKFDYKRWQYYLQTFKLCENLNYKPEEVYKMNIHFAFNNLTCLKEMDEELNRINK